MDPDPVLEVLHEAADAVADALRGVDDWGPSGHREGQYRPDLVADGAARAVLNRHELGVLSEESGRTGPDSGLLVVLDPLDGSTNAARGLPWFATSLCALDGQGGLAAVVANQANGTRYEAARGRGAWRDGRQIGPSDCREISSAVVGLSGYPSQHLGWAQYRVLGAAALDLCAVAEGCLDAFADVHPGPSLGPWDYLGGALVCSEAGAAVVELEGRGLDARGHGDRRRPVAAATLELRDGLVGELRRSFGMRPQIV